MGIGTYIVTFPRYYLLISIREIYTVEVQYATGRTFHETSHQGAEGCMLKAKRQTHILSKFRAQPQ